MIPKNIRRLHVLKAIKEVEKYGIPKGRLSRKFLLEYKGKTYPPKYVISLANRYTNGTELDPELFSGGSESNSFLIRLGFKIVGAGLAAKTARKPVGKKSKPPVTKKVHNERCPKCKETIRRLLENIYGRVHTNHRLTMDTQPEDFKKTRYYIEIMKIFEALQKHRGFKEFVKAKTLPHCDYFVPNPGFVLDFDESQHFTLPRKIALERYPEGLKLGFDRKRWIDLCKKINAKDHNPPYRDEQRAWYDTLRDFLPAIKGLGPTIRLFSRDCVWCSLDPANPRDVERFKNILKEEWGIDIREEPDPSLARIIIAIGREWHGNPDEARKLLEKVLEEWPKGKKAKFLLTCGAFIQFEWPKAITRREIDDNKNPKTEYVDVLIKEAEEVVKDFLGDGLAEKLGRVTDCMTLGIDSYKEKISTTKNYIGELHIELVCLIDLKNNEFYWSGKSYPTNPQQNGLVRIVDFKRHFFALEGTRKVMVLGCHDLNIFNNRNMKNTGRWRKSMKLEFRALAQKERPVMVLHHPHTTVTVATWRNAWNTLGELLPSVKQYAGAGRYFEDDREKKDWDEIDDVLQATKNTNTIDFIIE